MFFLCCTSVPPAQHLPRPALDNHTREFLRASRPPDGGTHDSRGHVALLFITCPPSHALHARSVLDAHVQTDQTRKWGRAPPSRGRGFVQPRGRQGDVTSGAKHLFLELWQVLSGHCVAISRLLVGLPLTKVL